jgi:hypothetical protein
VYALPSRMRVRCLVAAAVVTVVCAAGPALAGCGSVSPGAPPVTLRASDTGRTVHVAEGTRVDATLAPPEGYAPWRVPASSDPATVRPEGGGAGQQTKASFTALRPGQSTLRSDTHIACPPGRICPALAQAWTVVVVVDRR